MEYIEGRTIGDILMENMDLAEYYMKMSIDIQQKVHMVVTDKFELMSEKLTHQIESVQHLDKRLKSTLIQKLNSMTFKKRLCHGDFHLFNLILSKNEVTIIDWVDASNGLFKDEILEWTPIIAGARLSENMSSDENEHYLKIVNQYCPL